MEKETKSTKSTKTIKAVKATKKDKNTKKKSRELKKSERTKLSGGEKNIFVKPCDYYEVRPDSRRGFGECWSCVHNNIGICELGKK